MLILRKTSFSAEVKNFSISSIAFSQYLLHFCSFLVLRYPQARFPKTTIFMYYSSANASLLMMFFPILISSKVHQQATAISHKTWCWFHNSGFTSALPPSWTTVRSTPCKLLHSDHSKKVLGRLSNMIGFISFRSVKTNSPSFWSFAPLTYAWDLISLLFVGDSLLHSCDLLWMLTDSSIFPGLYFIFY